ncbi:hypothetical protein NO1_2308, partial [Candidatus Termititenax aidoneus]
AEEIFNSTWVRNDNDNHKFVLTNTPNTTPQIFDWTDVGQDTVAQFTDTLAGVIKGDSSAFGKVKSNTDGTGSVNGLLNNGDGTKALMNNGSYGDLPKYESWIMYPQTSSGLSAGSSIMAFSLGALADLLPAAANQSNILQLESIAVSDSTNDPPQKHWWATVRLYNTGAGSSHTLASSSAGEWRSDGTNLYFYETISNTNVCCGAVKAILFRHNSTKTYLTPSRVLTTYPSSTADTNFKTNAPLLTNQSLDTITTTTTILA